MQCVIVCSLTDFFGYIHDGTGNYSVGVKCSWLIDARDHSLYSNSLRNNEKTPTIRLHLEEFATECGWDHLYVFDGDSVESPLLAVYRYVYAIKTNFTCNITFFVSRVNI